MSSKSKSASKYVNDLFDDARELTSDTINPFSYWVLRGKIAAGEYPGKQFSKNPSTFIASVVHSVMLRLALNILVQDQLIDLLVCFWHC